MDSPWVDADVQLPKDGQTILCYQLFEPEKGFLRFPEIERRNMTVNGKLISGNKPMVEVYVQEWRDKNLMARLAYWIPIAPLPNQKTQ